MQKGILGKKLGMTQIFAPDGKVIPVTVVEAGPCVVVQKKTAATDGYNAVQLGFGTIRETLVNKPLKGHFDKHQVKPTRYLREFRLDDIESLNVGDVIKADIFAEGELVDVTGISRGKGFAGGIKRWNSARGFMSHGSKYHSASRLAGPARLGARAEGPQAARPAGRRAGHGTGPAGREGGCREEPDPHQGRRSRGQGFPAHHPRLCEGGQGQGQGPLIAPKGGANMPKVAVYNKEGATVGEINLSDAVFGAEVNPGLLHEVVQMYLAKSAPGHRRHQDPGGGPGGGRKPWRQKGTGRARHGSIRSPLWRKGGVVFGPHPRSIGWTMPKKARRAALRQALSAKVKNGELIVVDKFELEAPKTREVVTLLKNLKVDGSAFIVTAQEDVNIYKSARNIPGVRVNAARNLNAYEVLAASKLVFTQDAVAKVEEVLG